MNKIALITGATAGIGKACAELLAKNHYNLILTGRRKEHLESIKSSILSNCNIEIIALNFDIRSRSVVEKQIEKLPAKWKNIDVLINNAGLASGLDKIQEGSIDDWENMIDTNIKGLLYISRAVMPLMIKNRKGHIINIGSIAGKEVYPLGNVYCGTKHAVDALTKGMRIDLLEHEIKVTSINPGMVDTEFSLVRFHGDSDRAKAVYEGFEPLHAKDIADTVLFVLSRPKNVNINDLLIMPTVQASAGLIKKN